MPNLATTNDGKLQIFKASRYWESNVWGATITGIGGRLVISIVSGILLFDSEGPSGRELGGFLILIIIATFLAMFPGNMIAAVPVAVELKKGKSLRLIAPLKKLDVPCRRSSGLDRGTNIPARDRCQAKQATRFDEEFRHPRNLR